MRAVGDWPEARGAGATELTGNFGSHALLTNIEIVAVDGSKMNAGTR